MAVCVLATLYLGVLPGRALNYTAQSARQLVGNAAAPTAPPASSSSESSLETRLAANKSTRLSGAW